MALNKMCCINKYDNVAQKLKYMRDIPQNNIKLEKKQMVQSLQELRHVCVYIYIYILHICMYCIYVYIYI